MKKLTIIVFGLLAILGMIVYALWMPSPHTPARDAIGAEKSIERGTRTYAYHVSGKGDPVILLASAGREASDFNELVTALNIAGYRTIAIDAHGIKNSTLPEGDVTLFDMADDVAAVAEAEARPDEKIAVIGHAFGNRLARAFASRNDDRIGSIVLIASGGAKPIPEKANSALKNIFDPRRTVGQRRSDIDYGFFAEGNDIPDYWIVGWHTQTAILQGQATRTDVYDQWSAGGTKPMLVLQAAEDTIAPPQDAGIPLAQQYPDRVKLVVVPNAGHAFLPEQPDVIAEEVIVFLRSHSR
ncbi:MAG: alpha/beta hydrolase [Parasphingorhabdus sp.]